MAAKGPGKDYQPVKRMYHSTVRVGDYLYMWGGKQPNLPEVHNNEKKKSMCSVMEVYHLVTGRWEQKPTTGDWIPPTITGDRPPPLTAFTLTSINNSSAILFGGEAANGDSSNVFILDFTDTSVNCLKLSNPEGSVQWPEGRYGHSSVLINTSSGPHLLVAGGYCTYYLWIFDVKNKLWKKLFNRPKNVINRCFHSLSLWSVTPTTNWIIVFGGDTSHRDTAVIALRYASNNEWYTSKVPLDQYQEKLQERRREWEAPQLVQPEDRREIDRLTRVLQERERKLQVERKEKEQLRNRLQQQLQGREQQLQQAQQQGQERERQAREREQDLQQQLQERDEQLQEREQKSEQQRQEKDREIQHSREREQQLQREIQQGGAREQALQRQLQQAQQQGRERERQLQSIERESQEREQQLQRQLEGGQQREQDLQRQLQQAQQQLQESQERERGLEQQLRERDRQERESSWVVDRNDIRMTERILGRGGWREVRVARFHGLKVAAKVLHETIISEYNISLFSREMNIASKIRHPNLLQFIGATTEGNPIILTELMPTSLRKELEVGGLAYPEILRISLDVACALNYLHLFKPHPILHRDVSSANVLLQPMGGAWKAKVSDYGSANLQPLIGRTTNPGNPVYSAPEAANPREHSPSMDVFSYGVLLLEMITRRIPLPEERVGLIDGIRRASFRSLVQRCLIVEYRYRPTMNYIITELNDTI
uniref:Protein kinase domain-containing protein n=1 Tax=Amphimedon queenslandica TaxID=400682 RepID=A0A1X7T3W0_AMPQE